MSTTAASTEQIRLKRLAAAWARAYGAARSSPQRPKEQQNESRAIADAKAAWGRWHDAGLDCGWFEAEWPWFEALERARVEALASDHLPGIARNLADTGRTGPPAGLAGDLYRSARQIFGGIDTVPYPIFRSARIFGIFRRGKFWLRRRQLNLTDSVITIALLNARESLDHQIDFAGNVAPLVRSLSVLEAVLPSEASRVSGPRLGTPLADAVQESNNKEDVAGKSENPGDAAADPHVLRVYPDYRIYSTAWDEEGPAAQWLQPEDRGRLELLLSPDRRQIRQLAHKLQRRLQAASLRQWSFDQEEGLLDSRRLARLVSDQANHKIFRRERDSTVPSACVSFLVDLSGSMRGERQRVAAMTVDMVVHTLELCEIKCEVLGYTSVFGDGGLPADEWQRAGCPENPGRLNATRHIIFKSANQRWQRSRPSLGLMLRSDFGRENIDGEALHWASRRLAERPESNRILIVLSDGQPYDEATAAANGRSFLESHLRSVIKELERSPINLSAVGAGMSISRFYEHSVTISDTENIGDCLFNHLDKMLFVSKIEEGS